MKTKFFMLSILVAFAGAQARAIDYDTSMWFGTINPVTHVVNDRMFVGDNFTGLTYADQDLLGLGTTPTLFYSIRHDAGSGTSYLDTIATPVAPHVTGVVDRFGVGNLNYNALTFAAPDVGYGPTILYYLREDISAPQFGTIKPAGAYQDRFSTGNQLDLLTFTATDVGPGADLFYYIRHDVGGTYFGTIDPALPGTMEDRWILTKDNFDGLVFTDTNVGFGTNNFYYIRHDGTTNQHYFGALNPYTGVTLDLFPIGTVADDFDELTFTNTDVIYGANQFYYLRSTEETKSSVPDTGSTLLLLGSGLATLLAFRRRFSFPA